MSKPTLVEKIKAAIDDANSWDEGRAALAVVLEEMREPSEGMWHAGALAGSQGRTRAIWGWQAMLAQFEKEQAGG